MKQWLKRASFVVGSSMLALAACSDDDDTPSGGNAGSTSGGASSGSSSGGSTSGSSSVAGSATGGSSASGAAGHAGASASGGTAGSSATAGSGGSGGSGTAGKGGGGTAGDVSNAGAGGEGGTGGSEETILYDFESDVQGWAAGKSDTILSVDPTQVVTGSNALKIVVPAFADAESRTVAVVGPKLWPGTKVVMHLWSPTATGIYVQAYSQSDNWQKWDTAGNAGATLVAAGWTTLTYTIPQTFPGGLQALGVQIGASGAAFAGGTFYLDSITASGGVEACAGEGTGTFGFETAEIKPWEIDGNPQSPTPADTAIAQSTTQANTGTGALKVSFTALPEGTAEAPTPRRVYVSAPTAYCGDEVTFNVWTPVGSESLQFQAFSQSDNYAVWNADLPVATVNVGGWTQIKYTLPANIGPGGLQRVGVQFLNTGAAFTGDVYIDDVSW